MNHHIAQENKNVSFGTCLFDTFLKNVSIKHVPTVTLLILVAVLLVGCLPPQYSKNHKKELTEKYTPEAVAWFAENKPEAEVKRCESLTSSVDLYAALEGTYRFKGKSYQFIYDWYNKKMYVGEGYAQVCALVADKMSVEFNLDRDRTEFRFRGYGFETHLENDEPDERYTNQPEFYTIPDSEIIPADISILDFADQVLSGEAELGYSAYSYVDAYPEYEQEKLEKYPNMFGICYYIPMEGNFDGIYRKDYRRDGIRSSYCHIKEVNDYISAGYVLSGKESPDEDILNCTFEDKKNFTLTIPDSATAIIFSKKNKDFINHFVNPAGKYVEYEVDEKYREDCPGMKGYNLFFAEWVMNNEYKYAFNLLRNVSTGGVYQFRIE